ncbi:MAG: DEAD/DEAH box helicase [Candidatus Binatia bacterium]
MLAWHRREDSVKWTDYFRLCDWARRGEVGSQADAVDPAQHAWSELNGDDAGNAVTGVRPGTEHESVLQDLVLLEKTPPPAGTRQRKCTYRLSCRAGAWKVKTDDALEVQFVDEERRGTATVLEIDPQEGTAVVTTTSDLAGVHALVLKPFAGPEGPWLSLMRLAEAALEDSAPAWAQVGLGLLDQRAPVALASVIDRSKPADAAREIVAAMAAGDVLPVQGPPGTGKTWLAAQIVADEIERASAAGCGARIGVTANSHKVIDNLLTGVLRVARERKLAVDVTHVNSKPLKGHDAAIEQLDPASALPSRLAAASPATSLVVGATKYGWSRADVVESLQLLIIDEAGQVPLADALSVVQAAPRVLAVGDPQQLAAPIVAAHDAELKVSLLEHLIQGQPTIAPEAGIFLDVSHRMHPALCQVVGRLAYASQLSASDKAAARRLEGTSIDVCGTMLPMRPGVIHLPVSGGPEKEVDAVVELLARLTGGSVLATPEGEPATAAGSAEALAPLRAADVLVVAPHNAHVNRLRHELPGYEIGTVDKFQGRQAHVVVYAMGRTAEVPGDVPFLYELNRVNVALSRARLLAVVVTSPLALLPPVAEPGHLRLASRFVRAVGGPRPTSPV